MLYIDGVWKPIIDTTDRSKLKTEMRSYYSYLAKGFTSDRIFWTEPYDDFQLGVKMVTAAKPVYVKSQSGTQDILLGNKFNGNNNIYMSNDS